MHLTHNVRLDDKALKFDTDGASRFNRVVFQGARESI